MTPNQDQSAALAEILAAYGRGATHLLTGYAGSGKTTLMQVVAQAFRAKHRKVALAAPTHKAVAVLARKIADAGLEVPCVTIHNLLSLKPKTHGDRLLFQRSKHAQPVTADVVVIDECSMVSADLHAHIRRHLGNCFVLFVGDPAQLPPVGEKESGTFSTKSRSHLSTIVRQAQDNPVLAAAHTIRGSQGGPMDWSWCKPACAKPFGVYMPGENSPAWMQKAFTSPEFDADPDTFRYLCWTNDRVAQVNRHIRRWRYGAEIPTPFMPGERAMVRQPIVRDDTILFATNEEAEVVEIEEATCRYPVPGRGAADSWIAEFPSWQVTLRKADGLDVPVHMPRSDRDYNRVIAKITDEAALSYMRWDDLHAFKSSVARLQSIYAMTVHTSQGSTFGNTFVDVADIRRRAESNVLEAQQLFYVAATRASRAMMLVNT